MERNTDLVILYFRSVVKGNILLVHLSDMIWITTKINFTSKIVRNYFAVGNYHHLTTFNQEISTIGRFWVVKITCIDRLVFFFVKIPEFYIKINCLIIFPCESPHPLLTDSEQINVLTAFIWWTNGIYYWKFL